MGVLDETVQRWQQIAQQSYGSIVDIALLPEELARKIANPAFFGKTNEKDWFRETPIVSAQNKHGRDRVVIATDFWEEVMGQRAAEEPDRPHTGCAFFQMPNRPGEQALSRQLYDFYIELMVKHYYPRKLAKASVR